MSAGYANRLKEYPNKGVCGLPEVPDTKRTLGTKIRQLAGLWKDSKHTVVLTGAGISTSAGIPDFRGPQGIWTAEKNRTDKKRKRSSQIAEDSTASASMDFSKAQPTLTHRALVRLQQAGHLHYVVTQNVDGLHWRSGLSRSHHAVLHGCAFTEKCEACHTMHFRDFDVGGMSFSKTGRKCEACDGDLRDTLLDWEDPLPEEDFEQATEECEKADLVVTLGTSLRIEPAGSLPTNAKKFCIVNLQETPYDKDADLIVRGRVDQVMQGVMEELGFGKDWDNGGNRETPTIERLWKRETPVDEEST